MDPLEGIKLQIQTSLNELKAMYDENDKIAAELINDWFKLQLEWMDKIITLSVSIISLTITVLLALQDKNIHPSCAFYWMWWFFAFSAWMCLFSRFSYANVKLAQGKTTRLFQKDVHEGYYKVVKDNETLIEMNVEFLSPKQVDIIDPSTTNIKLWSFFAKYSNISGIIFFMVGMGILIYIGGILIR